MLDRLVELGCPIDEVNVGGGLRAPARQDEQPVDLDAYATVLARQLGPRGVAVAVEPGDYITKDAAILLGEVVTVEDRAGVRFVGLDLGWNIDCSYFIYRFLQEAVLCRAPLAERLTQLVTLAGHINEAGDVFAESTRSRRSPRATSWSCSTPAATKQAMSSTHCLRPMAPARFLERRAVLTAGSRAAPGSVYTRSVSVSDEPPAMSLRPAGPTCPSGVTAARVLRSAAT